MVNDITVDNHTWGRAAVWVDVDLLRLKVCGVAGAGAGAGASGGGAGVGLWILKDIWWRDLVWNWSCRGECACGRLTQGIQSWLEHGSRATVH